MSSPHRVSTVPDKFWLNFGSAGQNLGCVPFQETGNTFSLEFLVTASARSLSNNAQRASKEAAHTCAWTWATQGCSMLEEGAAARNHLPAMPRFFTHLSTFSPFVQNIPFSSLFLFHRPWWPWSLFCPATSDKNLQVKNCRDCHKDERQPWKEKWQKTSWNYSHSWEIRSLFDSLFRKSLAGLLGASLFKIPISVSQCARTFFWGKEIENCCCSEWTVSSGSPTKVR